MTSGISASLSQLLITCSIHTPPPSSSSLSLPPFSWMADDCRMARDETAVSALSFEKRTQLLNSKFAILNREFVRFLCDEVNKDAEIDLTPTVTSYIDNVKDLRRMYNLGAKEGEKEKRDGEIVRKKATARRRLKGGEGEKNTGGNTTLPCVPKTPQLKMSTPAGLSAPSTLEMSADISAISPFGGTAIKKVEKDAGDETLKALPPTIGAPSGGACGRKRAIRGGGPAGDGESIVFRGATQTTSSTPTITVKPPPITFQLPKGSAGFWDTKPAGDDNKEKKKDELKDEEKKDTLKGEDKKEETKPFTFGSGTAPKFTGFNFGGIASSSTESAPKLAPSTGGFNLFGAINTTSSLSSSSTPTLTFGLPKPSVGLTFPSSTTASSTTEGGADGDEEGEYVPPKADVVENKEEDAKISLKCAVFKLEEKEYTKLGVGQLYVKENDGKSSLLVRAATTTGTILVNGRIDGSMKAEKADDMKLRVSVPVSSTEIKTFLIRLPNKEDAEKVLTLLKDGGAK